MPNLGGDNAGDGSERKVAKADAVQSPDALELMKGAGQVNPAPSNMTEIGDAELRQRLETAIRGLGSGPYEDGAARRFLAGAKETAGNLWDKITGTEYPAMRPQDVASIGKAYVDQSPDELEKGARKSIVAGLQWMAENPGERPRWTTWRTADRSVSPANEAARQVEAVMDKAYDGHSGASFGWSVRKMLEFRNGGVEKFAESVNQERFKNAPALDTASVEEFGKKYLAAGDPFEKGIRQSVVAGLKWMAENPGEAPSWSQSTTLDKSMFAANEAARKVEQAMVKAYDGHSGASFGSAVRQMVAIRLNGLEGAAEKMGLSKVSGANEVKAAKVPERPRSPEPRVESKSSELAKFDSANPEGFAAVLKKAEAGDLTGYGRGLDLELVREVSVVNKTLETMLDAAKSGTGPEVTNKLVTQTIDRLANKGHSGMSFSIMQQFVIATAREDVGRAVFKSIQDGRPSLKDAKYEEYTEGFDKAFGGTRASEKQELPKFSSSTPEGYAALVKKAEEGRLTGFGRSMDMSLVKDVAVVNSTLETMADAARNGRGPTLTPDLVAKTIDAKTADSGHSGASYSLMRSLVIATAREDVGRAVVDTIKSEYPDFKGSYESMTGGFDKVYGQRVSAEERPLEAKARVGESAERSSILRNIAKIEEAIAPRKASASEEDRRSFERINRDLSEIKALLDGSKPELADKYAAFGGPERVLQEMQLALGLSPEAAPSNDQRVVAGVEKVIDPAAMSPKQMREALDRSGLKNSNPAEYQRVSTLITGIEEAERLASTGDTKARDMLETKRVEWQRAAGRAGMALVLVGVMAPYATNAMRK